MDPILPIPDIFIAGAPKCGTTSLHAWLSDHPDIHAPRKESNYFSQDIYPTNGHYGHIASLQEYCQIYDKTTTGKMYSCDATPKYLYSDYALSEISRLRPDAKIIICLRDPVNLAISLHGQKLKESVENEISFERAWSRCYGASSGDLIYLPEVDGKINYYFWALFGVRLQKLIRMFPSDSILILLDYEMKSDPRSAYLRVLDFIGIKDDGRNDFATKNQRSDLRSYSLNKVVHWLRRETRCITEPVRKLRGGRSLGIGRIVNKFNMLPSANLVPVSPEFRSRMYGLLENDIRLAESFLNGRSLSTGLMQMYKRNDRPIGDG